MARLSNPFAFTRVPVTIITTAIYVALLAVLIVIQVELPPQPTTATPDPGLNLTEAWQDLQLLSAHYHPYNSRDNDLVHDWLLTRIEEILKSNHANSSDAYVFDDRVSNLTSSTASVTTKKTNSKGISVYFEGTNIITYIRGTEDDSSEWWKDPKGKPSTRNGVLVNAHYDSVSTGFGSTDDGVGVVTVLQLISYFSTHVNKPRNGLVFLLNNGEEDFLNGARAFSQHPMSKFISTFLNLEGAGAGGRAALFRSTDEEVTSAYARSPYPYGTVLSGDGFQRGLVRSQTDYVIFNGILGYRGLDVAFIAPRARYHTNQDDSRHTGKKAIWHMVSSATATTKNLAMRHAITTDDTPHRSIWFDILGKGFAVIRAHTFFALSITLLVVGPILMLATIAILYRVDKLYIFSNSRHMHTTEGDDPVPLYGWRGCFRFPFILLFASAAPVALAYLLFKENEQIAHSSPWSIWAMMISAFIFVAWFLARFADYVRPSALTRVYGLGWLTVGWWLILIVAVIYEEQFHLGGLYFALFFCATAGLSTWLSYVELFSLPKKSKYCATKMTEDEDLAASREGSRAPASESSRAPEAEPEEDDDDDQHEATERSSLLKKGRQSRAQRSRHEDDDKASLKLNGRAEYDEQEWSSTMWTWLWLLQVLVLVPLNIILIGQIGLFLVDGLHQTGQDGSSMFTVYIGMAIVTILIFSPVVPFIHRLTWHLPMFFLLVLIATLVFNLLAFPFSPQNRLKVYFQQEIDLDRGNNSVSLLAIEPFIHDAINNIPSAAGQVHHCTKIDGRSKCSWEGVMPQVVPEYSSSKPLKKPYKSWMNYNVTLIDKKSDTRMARFMIQGKNTRACKLVFDSPISGAYIHGQAPEDKRFPPIPEGGSGELRLWSRTWDGKWTIDVSWDSDEHGKALSGKAVCLWSDINQKDVIPAFDEVEHYVPNWVAVSKAGDGLVEGSKRFSV